MFAFAETDQISNRLANHRQSQLPPNVYLEKDYRGSYNIGNGKRDNLKTALRQPEVIARAHRIGTKTLSGIPVTRHFEIQK